MTKFRRRKTDRELTNKEKGARQENAQHSTGPRTELGKERVRANAVKSGYYADKIAYQAMIALGEDPKEYVGGGRRRFALATQPQPAGTGGADRDAVGGVDPRAVPAVDDLRGGVGRRPAGAGDRPRHRLPAPLQGQIRADQGLLPFAF